MEAIIAEAALFFIREVLRIWQEDRIVLLAVLVLVLTIFRNAGHLRAKLGLLELEIDNRPGGMGSRRPPTEDRPSASDAGAEVPERDEVRPSDERCHDERGRGEVDDGERPSEGSEARAPRLGSTAPRGPRAGRGAAGRGGAPAPGAGRAAGCPKEDRRKRRGRRRG